jgi:hypothetical protein
MRSRSSCSTSGCALPARDGGRTRTARYRSARPQNGVGRREFSRVLLESTVELRLGGKRRRGLQNLIHPPQTRQLLDATAAVRPCHQPNSSCPPAGCVARFSASIQFRSIAGLMPSSAPRASARPAGTRRDRAAGPGRRPPPGTGLLVPYPGYDDTDTKIIKPRRRSPYDRYEKIEAKVDKPRCAARSAGDGGVSA